MTSARIFLPWIYDASSVLSGYPRYIFWNGKHTLISGMTGSGKTITLSLLLARIALYMPGAMLYMLDYKTEFGRLKGCDRYYGYDACDVGMQDFHEAFIARMDGTAPGRTPVIICIDEWAAFINAQEKKQGEEYKKLLGLWLQLGRSLGIVVIVGVQRPDASANFPGGARDQFGTVFTLGNQSKEAVRMVFDDYKEQIKPVQQIGEGYMLMDGRFYHAQTPTIRNIPALVSEIRRIV